MRFDSFQREMQQGATLLVPNQRSARAWRKRLFDPNAPSTLAVLPWTAWAVARWQDVLLQGDDDRILLNPLQNIELWTQVLHNAQPGTLRPIRSLVRLCAAAQHLVHTHGAAGRLLSFYGEAGSDVAVYADWFRSYTRRCEADRLLPASALDDALATHAASAQLAAAGEAAAPTIFLLGFDRLLPAQTHLLDRMVAAGATVAVLDAADLCGFTVETPTLLRCMDEQNELDTLVQGLRQHLPNDADASVLLVLPDVEASRAALERALRSPVEGDQVALPAWEFAAGRPLTALPLAASALQLLRWATGPLPAETVSILLQSPFLHLRIDRERAGELDAEILRDGRRLRPEWTIAGLRRALGRLQPAMYEGLQDALQCLEATAAQHLRGRRLQGEWGDLRAGGSGRRRLARHARTHQHRVPDRGPLARPAGVTGDARPL